jgi:hypothetical protein
VPAIRFAVGPLVLHITHKPHTGSTDGELRRCVASRRRLARGKAGREEVQERVVNSGRQWKSPNLFHSRITTPGQLTQKYLQTACSVYMLM